MACRGAFSKWALLSCPNLRDDLRDNCSGAARHCHLSIQCGVSTSETWWNLRFDLWNPHLCVYYYIYIYINILYITTLHPWTILWNGSGFRYGSIWFHMVPFTIIYRFIGGPGHSERLSRFDQALGLCGRSVQLKFGTGPLLSRIPHFPSFTSS